MPVVAVTFPFRPLLLLAGALALAACSASTKVDGAWAENASRDQSFGKVLLVGVSPAYNTRCRFERMLMNEMNANGVRSITSCASMSSKDPLSRDAIVEVVKATGADAVLATRLVDGNIAVKEGGTDEARGEAYYKPLGYGYAYDAYYGSYGMPVTYVDFVAEDPQLTVRRNVVISSNLYETKDAALVYTLDTVAKNAQSREEIIELVTTAIGERLRRDGLVR
jgi:hypothetical protein